MQCVTVCDTSLALVSRESLLSGKRDGNVRKRPSGEIRDFRLQNSAKVNQQGLSVNVKHVFNERHFVVVQYVRSDQDLYLFFGPNNSNRCSIARE